MNASASIGRGLPVGLAVVPDPTGIERQIAAGFLPSGELQGLLRLQAGEVELYWQRGGEGRRCFLGAFKPGSLLCAFELGPNFTFFTPSGATLSVMNPQTTPRAELIDGVDEWTQTIGKAAADYAGPRPPAQTIEAGAGEPALPGAVLAAARGVVWIEVDDGEFGLLGAHPTGKGYLPLTPALWARRQSDPPHPFQVLSTVALASDKKLGRGAVQFHAALSEALEQLLDRAETDAAKTLETSDAAIQTEFFASTHKLVGVLDAPEAVKAPLTDVFDFVIGVIVSKSGLRPKPEQAAPDIASYAEARGLRTRTVILRDNWWKEDRGDLVCFYGVDRAPVAVKIDWRGRYRLHAPGARPVRLTPIIASQLHFDALALIEPLPNRPIKPLDILILGARACSLEIGTLATASLFATLISFALPVATGFVIDTLVPDRLRTGVLVLGAMLVVLMVCHGLLDLVVDVAKLRIDGRFGAALQAGMLDRVMRLPSRFIKSQSSADLALRVMSIEQMRRLVTGIVLNSLLTGVFGFASFGVLIVYSPIAALAALGLLLALIGVSVIAGMAQVRAFTIGEAMSANVASLTLQMIQNIVVLKSFGAEPRAYTRWAQNVAEMRKRGLRSRYASISFETFIAGFEGVAMAVIVLTLGISLEHASLPTGVLLAFFGAFQGLLGTTEGLARGIMQFTAALPTIKRASALLAAPPESSAAARTPQPLTGEIEFNGVSFSYPGAGRRALNGVTIRCESGCFTAVVGPSGSGKSTLLHLLLGFEAPDAGSVLFDGQDLATLDKAAVRRQIGVVHQGGRLFSGTILENILGSHGGDSDAAWEAARLAGIAGEIRSMPMGMHTAITEGSASLSGGQVQRLLVARALAGKPKILVLDEATSALDNITQRHITQNIEKLGITRLVVAHRLSTILNADKICFIEGGELIQSGGFEELIRTNETFAHFARRQQV